MASAVLAPGRVAVVTGAGSGIGAALARALAHREMRVVLADIDTSRIDSLAQELDAAGLRAIAVAVDVSDRSSVEKLAHTVRKHWGPTNLLVNNAGIETTGCLWEIPSERWNATIGVNLTGVYHGIQAFVPAMISDKEPAHVVNLASVGGLTTGPFQAPYIITKHGVLVLTECLWQEFAAQNIDIGVSAVLPGPVSTEIFADALSADASGDGATHLQQMRQLLATHGMSPKVVAELVLAGVEAGDLWIHTHPEMSDAAIRARTSSLLSREPYSALEQSEGIADANS
ncbi:SDR family NAD(P)-dependent oxidoreductase [Rhodococcus sp. IEGM 1366]|uniref:SDR family NAD(P)-dependent oxidoreductase n=1 Tax=Rhodococcus sp. IEGM 1366 TaxID=3082223 RepID=UPI002954E5E4|nr:SDR family NAD(P)-dependent oxidoreductase [Rhodococcus sp. IEGM 1366]MDV8070688.1 SDR family NAD(P)-dependent oxidoreductase [Rhodococcus sp. IEGM 1366]